MSSEKTEAAFRAERAEAIEGILDALLGMLVHESTGLALARFEGREKDTETRIRHLEQTQGFLISGLAAVRALVKPWPTADDLERVQRRARASMLGDLTHELKCEAESFGPIKAGVKRFTVRKNDRGFAVGHILALTNTDTCERIFAPIDYVWPGGRHGIDPDYVILGLGKVF